jgi:hypothetical protein
MIFLSVAALAIALAAFTYFGLERLGSRAWVPMAFRSVAWTVLGLLLINVSCPVRGPLLRPLVLLDASLSLGAVGGRWRAARDSALRWGDVRGFGDERTLTDTLPTRGRSLLAPALLAASGSDRPILIVSDGEIEDLPDIPPDILARSGIRLFARETRPDIAMTQLSGPARASAGDSIPLDVTVQLLNEGSRDNLRLEVFTGSTRLTSRMVRLRGTSARTRLVIPPTALSPGDHLLRVALTGNRDAEPRTDIRLHLITIAQTPGVVFLAGPADWDSRFLYRTLRSVSQLPVRGYVRLEPNRWRSMETLRPISLQQVRRSARQADLLILKGGVKEFGEGSRARGLWSWPSGEAGESEIPGDWYLSPAQSSPLSGAFIGQPMDSFPPAVQLIPMEAGPQDWVALYAQLARRGPQRPAVLGRREGGVRRVTVAADGLWRWAFRGGPSEQSYRSWVAATTSWLLAGTDSTGGAARAVHPVVPNGRPVLFEWTGSGTAVPQGITWATVSPAASTDPAIAGPDTLHFDGNGRATVWLPPGQYRYRLASGASGIVAVEEYSDELLPRPVTLTAHEGRLERPTRRTTARDRLWLFALCVLALSAEWLARRRLGLR